MNFFEKTIPDYITDKRNTTRQLIFTAVFALVFINLYSPFGVNTWYDLTKPELFFYSSLVILTGLLILAISRIIMHQSTKRRKIKNGRYIIWIAVEIVSLAFVYLILQRIVVEQNTDVFEAYKETLKITSLVLLFPYTISYLYFSYLEKNRKLEELTAINTAPKASPSGMIAFRDSKRELKFSLKENDLLFLEAADNYVNVHYLDRGKHASYLIRNSLRNIEDDLKALNIIRCHRSYLVNPEKVKMVRKESDGLILELDTAEKHCLPVSRSYVEEVMQFFSNQKAG